MKISKPKLILNPYEWLPGYGETKVSCRYEGVDLLLEIEYERELIEDSQDEVLNLKRGLLFKRVNSFLKMPFPGSMFFEFAGKSDEFRLGVLTEFTKSDWVSASQAAWRALYTHTPPIMRHFSIQFMGENIAFEILAAEVILTDENIIHRQG